ncbi:MAG: DinB family protein [Stackebrandtia sp.]
MTTSQDRLAELLDAVTTCLERPDLDGAELAERAHLSRYHFDRLLSAGLGETPGAFRRRLLLERAAYRLVSGDETVTRLAFEAGYGSHEAFTRAFRRAFGYAPSRHRTGRQPVFRIPAANGIHFHPPGGIRLPASERNAMSVLSDLLDHHVWLVGELLDRARRLDESALDTRFEYNIDYGSGDTSARELLSHLVWQCERWLASTEGEPAPELTDRPIPTLIAGHREAGPRWAETVRAALDEGRVDETFIDTQCDPPETYTYGGMVSHVIHYGTIHRSLVIGALRDAGAHDLPSADPMRWIADAHR